MTVTCARCHDHKFDPIPTTDYYALAGIFTSTENAAGLRNKMGGGGLDYYDPSSLVVLSGKLPAPPDDRVKELQGKIAAAKKTWDAIRGTPEGLAKGPDGRPKQRPFRLEYERLNGEFLALTDPALADMQSTASAMRKHWVTLRSASGARRRSSGRSSPEGF